MSTSLKERIGAVIERAGTLMQPWETIESSRRSADWQQICRILRHKTTGALKVEIADSQAANKTRYVLEGKPQEGGNLSWSGYFKGDKFPVQLLEETVTSLRTRFGV